MIWVTKLDGTELAVNSDHILTAEATPDTLLALTNGERIIVKQTVPEVIERVLVFRQSIVGGRNLTAATPAPTTSAPTPSPMPTTGEA